MSHRYISVAKEESDTEETIHKFHPLSAKRIFSSTAFVLGSVCVALFAGFLLGKWTTGTTKADSESLALSTIEQTFRYNRAFSNPPSNVTNEAWEKLYPDRGTYFTHSPVVPFRSTLSVFHQLHCLDGIRHAYWQVYNAAMAGEKLSPKDIPMMSSPPHVRHCIDLLRQSLMCQADTTVEVKDEKAGGVHGFGVSHQCKDWKQLKHKLEKWQREKINISQE